MKEIATCTDNQYMLITEKDGEVTARPICELILVTVEPEYVLEEVDSPIEGGVKKIQLVKHLKSESHRFSASPVVLRKMSETFAALADNADEIERSANELDIKRAEKPA